MKVKDLKKIADEQFTYFGETGLYPERCISFLTRNQDKRSSILGWIQVVGLNCL